MIGGSSVINAASCTTDQYRLPATFFVETKSDGRTPTQRLINRHQDHKKVLFQLVMHGEGGFSIADLEFRPLPEVIDYHSMMVEHYRKINGK